MSTDILTVIDILNYGTLCYISQHWKCLHPNIWTMSYKVHVWELFSILSAFFFGGGGAMSSWEEEFCTATCFNFQKDTSILKCPLSKLKSRQCQEKSASNLHYPDIYNIESSLGLPQFKV